MGNVLSFLNLNMFLDLNILKKLVAFSIGLFNDSELCLELANQLTQRFFDKKIVEVKYYLNSHPEACIWDPHDVAMTPLIPGQLEQSWMMMELKHGLFLNNDSSEKQTGPHAVSPINICIAGIAIF